ncbi:nucleoside recognition domain-containing protein [Salidesulfovibrio brasiliensis]
MNFLEKTLEFVRSILRDAVMTAIDLYKVMVPILIGVKLLQEFDLIRYVAMPIKPLMAVVGLPAEAGLVWAFAMVNNIYTALVVAISLWPDMVLTQAQATVLGVLMLVAHAVPLEAAVARKSGPKVMFQSVIRIVGALVLGWALHAAYSASGVLTEPAVMLVEATRKADPTIMQWAWGELKNLGYIFLIILTLMVMMRLLSAIGVIDLLNRLLQPVLRLIGIGPKASAITVIGLTLGITYGSGLIIKETRSGNLGKEDVFYSLTFMGIAHALIEDTLLILLMGAHISGALWGRLAFAMLLTAILVQLTRRLSARFCDTYLWGTPT